MLPPRFIVRQTGHPEEEDIILDLERSEAVCRRCDRPTLGAAIAQALRPCPTCGPSSRAAVLTTLLDDLGAYFGALGMLQERCPRCNAMPPWEPPPWEPPPWEPPRRRTDNLPEAP
jgi:hypothetical protein